MSYYFLSFKVEVVEIFLFLANSLYLTLNENIVERESALCFSYHPLLKKSYPFGYYYPNHVR
jgi:hypothetical protein